MTLGIQVEIRLGRCYHRIVSVRPARGAHPYGTFRCVVELWPLCHRVPGLGGQPRRRSSADPRASVSGGEESGHNLVVRLLWRGEIPQEVSAV